MDLKGVVKLFKFVQVFPYCWISLVAQQWKEKEKKRKRKSPPAIQETQEAQVWSLDQEDPLEKGMETHSSSFAKKIPWTEETGRLPPMGSLRVEHDWSNWARTHSLLLG